MKNKKTIIMGIIIAVLVVVIAVMGGYMLAGRSKNDNSGDSYLKDGSGQMTSENMQNDADDDKESIGESEAVTEQGGSQLSETGEKPETESGKKSDFYVEIGHESTWEAAGKTCATENINIYNKTSSNVSGWKLDVVYKGAPSIDNIWNGEKKIRDNTVSITPADYNQEIPAGGSVNVGYNIASDDLTVEDYILYIEGKEYRSSDISGDKETTESDKNKDTTEGTTEGTTEDITENKTGETPFEIHGQLAVDGTDIVDSSGNKYQLKGASTHGITWFPDYVDKSVFQYLRDDWGANLVRIAMYTDTGDNNGYCSGGDKEKIKDLVNSGVSAATELGMYAIVDWHILNDNNPNTHIDEAKDFFEYVSSKYSENHNVIYEICNEPNGGTSWAEIKSYAETIIPIIRKNDKDAIIIVGTPNWSQDVDVASADPITGYDNIMYAVHFYAATHKDDLRNKVETALSNGLPVFVSEFSLCDASGNGAIDYESSDAWFQMINENNLSYASWSLCNKDETSALFMASSSIADGISDDELSDTGKYVKNKILGN